MATPGNPVTLSPVDSGNGTLTDEFLHGLVQGNSWSFGGGAQVLTYSLNFNDDGMGGFGPGGAWTPTLTAGFQAALASWSNVANISFQQISSGTFYYQSSADIAATLTGDDLQNQPAFVGAIGLGVIPDPALADDLLTSFGFTRSFYPNLEGD